ncbi:phospholipase D family protein [Guyparkeria hydrothermalis]|uniref:phospholipase D family protein n=1 Tax=Guyparkeria hydrothermalis TaxID=923 RepID=UPI002021AD52|nr:phospholipase D family protein [Guyparkeria hydrothermalis]MCL7744264.1 phospholipase D family protein [Guyparkeria hydrothermalis]
MLEPQDRQLLLESLKPPVGHQLDRAIGTTYSLDLHALLTAPLAFTFFDWQEDEETRRPDPLALLRSVREYANRMAIFCQAGEIHVPPRSESMFAYLEGSVFPVHSPQGGVFHPKIWLLRYKGEGDEVLYRFLCLSRNLTFDRSWDTALVLDGRVGDSERDPSINQPLIDFLGALPAMTTATVSPEWIREVQTMQDDLREIVFDPPPGVERMRFWPIGTRSAPIPDFVDSRSPLLVTSPFLAEEFLARLRPEERQITLATRLDSAEAVEQDLLETFNDTLILAEEANPEQVEVEKAEADGADMLSGLHAKFYLVDEGAKARLWTGSANATTAAFCNNVEFLVELVGDRKRMGIPVFLSQEAGSNGFRDLFRKYVPSTTEKADQSDQQKLEERVGNYRRELAGTELCLSVTPGRQEGRYQFRLEGALPEADVGWHIKVRPVTLSQQSLQQVDPGGDPVADFGEISIEAISAFLVVDITAEESGLSARSQFVLRLPIEGEPDHRFEELLSSIVENRAAFFRLLLMMLADIPEASRDLHEMHGMLSSSAQGRGSGGGQIPMLETLLKALDRDPERLDQVAKVVEELRRTDKGADLIPTAFQEVWEPIWQTRETLRRHG